MLIEKLTPGAEYRLTLSIKQLSAIERGLYKLTKHANDPDSYSLQFELKDFLRKELAELKRRDAAPKETESADKLNLLYKDEDGRKIKTV